MEYQKAYNNLSNSELERLALLSEEIGEVQQAIGKILRHGYENVNPNNGITNRESLCIELGDVYHAIMLMWDAKDLDLAKIINSARTKEGKCKRYLHHQ